MGKFDGLRCELNIFYNDKGSKEFDKMYNFKGHRFCSRSYHFEQGDTATSTDLYDLYSVATSIIFFEFKDKDYDIFLTAYNDKAYAFDIRITKTNKKNIDIGIGHKSNFTELGIKRYLRLNENEKDIFYEDVVKGLTKSN